MSLKLPPYLDVLEARNTLGKAQRSIELQRLTERMQTPRRMRISEEEALAR
jgi:hypothetical protein